MFKIEEVWSFFQEQGKPVERKATQSISLPAPHRFYAVRNGCIDFYFVPAGKEGPRTFLMNLESGLLLPLAPFPGFDLIALAREEGEILDCDQQTLSQLPIEPFAESLQESISQLSRGIFDASNEEQRKELEETLSFLRERKWEEGVSRFSEKLSARIFEKMQQTQMKEEQTLTDRDLQAETNFESSLTEMQGLLNPTIDADINRSKDLLFYEMKKIEAALHFSFHFPPHLPSDLTTEEKIQKICESSQMCYRKIRLKGEWWRQDRGPLLAFSKEEPIALINGEYFLSYTQIGPKGQKKVDAQSAANFSDKAYMFYVPFPSQLKTGKEVLGFFAKHTGPQWKLLLFFSLLGTLISLFPPLAAYLLFKYGIGENSVSLVSYLALGLFFSTVGISLFYFFRNYCLLKIEGLGVHFIQTALWDRLLKLSPSFFRKFSIGNLYYRVMSTEDLSESLSNLNITTVLNGFFSLFYLIVLFAYSPLLAFIVLSFALIAFGLTLICAWVKIRYLTEFTNLQGTIRGVAFQIILGVAKLRTSGAEKSAFAYWASLFAKAKRWQMKAQSMQNAALSLSVLFPILTYWGVYAGMVYGIGIQKLPLPEFLSFNIALGYFSASFYLMGLSLVDMAKVFPSWTRTQVILEEPLEESEKKASCPPLTGHIRMDKIFFSYDPDSPLVLRGVTLVVHPREFVAIVGKSGSGKSTLARLLLRFEKPNSGSIYFDGQDLSHLDPRSVRRQIGSVLQGDRIGGGSLYENLVCGASYPKEQILHALKISGFDKDLPSLPMGLNTFVPAGGETLSGGQKQRLLLARAFLSNPPLLILDEATSALDNQTQQEVSGYIDGLSVTRIVIAQRLRTIRNADRIYVLDQGEIIDSGRFDELVARKGLFADMAARQRL